jgi:hypothetical protein
LTRGSKAVNHHYKHNVKKPLLVINKECIKTHVTFDFQGHIIDNNGFNWYKTWMLAIKCKQKRPYKLKACKKPVKNAREKW